MPTSDLNDTELDILDDQVSDHLLTVRAAREIKRHRATMRRLDQWARELATSGSTTNVHFARVLRGKLAGE